MIDKKTAEHDDTQHLLSSEENAKQLRESITEFSKIKPTVYLIETEDSVIVSAYSEDHEAVERYSLDIIALRGASLMHDSPNNTLTILRNILERAGVSVVIE
jgi:hypothetical protein